MHLHWNGLIPIAGGIFLLLASYRVIQLGKNPDASELWLRKFGPMSKILGPIIILSGLGQLFGLFR